MKPCTYAEHAKRVVEAVIASLDRPLDLFALQVTLEKGPVVLLLQEMIHLSKRPSDKRWMSHVIRPFETLQAYSTRRSMGLINSSPTLSPASAMSSRTENRIVAQRSVNRKQASLLTCGD